MDGYINIEIPIPADNEGYVLLKCPLCGEMFKLMVSDIEDDSQLNIWCPSCGLVSESYLPEDVIELAERLIQNFTTDMLNAFAKDIENIFKNNSFVKSKTISNLKKEATDPIAIKIENLEEQTFKCCHKSAKILPSLKFAGCYCPFCGEVIDGNR